MAQNNLCFPRRFSDYLDGQKSKLRCEIDKDQCEQEMANKVPMESNLQTVTGHHIERIVSERTSFKGYQRHFSRRVVISNIKADHTSFENVQKDIINYCFKRNVRVTHVHLLRHHSERRYPTFVVRVNIDGRDYSKTQCETFWPESVRVRDWIARGNRN